MEEIKKNVSADDVCRHFDRISESLIEEPEICEWCAFYRDGECVYKEIK